MKEVVSLLVVFIVAAVVYEFMKPKNNSQSTNRQKESDEDED